MMRFTRTGALASAFAVALILSGCAVSVPADPQGTFDRVQNGALRVGASIEDGLVVDVDGELVGPLVDLVEEFADRHDAEVQWTVGSEESLVDALDRGELDLMVGGMTPDTPWIDQAGATRGYPVTTPRGEHEMVMLVPLGENRFLTELETFLDEEVGG